MFHLFKKRNDITGIDMASFLKIHPEKLKEFEEAYQTILDIPDLTDNLLDSCASQNIAPKDVEVEKDIPIEIVDRIVDELVEGTQYFSFKEGKISSGIFHGEGKMPVSLEEIQQLSKAVRPQLTGHLMQRDTAGEASRLVMETYKKYLEENNPKKKMIAYQLFRVGLDTCDLDAVLYQVLGMNRNSMGHWLPPLAKAIMQVPFFKIPDTIIIKVPLPMLQLSRLAFSSLTPTTLKIVDRYCQKVFQLKEDQEYFVKTGVFSSKYDFRNAHVYRPKEVREFIENQKTSQRQKDKLG